MNSGPEERASPPMPDVRPVLSPDGVGGLGEANYGAVLRLFIAKLTAETARAFIVIMGAGSVALGALIAGTLVSGSAPKIAGVLWLITTVTQVWVLVQLARAVRWSDAATWALLSVALMLLWCSLLPGFGIAGKPEWLLFFGMVAGIVGVAPWPLRIILALEGCIAICIIMLLDSGPSLAIGAPLLAFMMLVAVRNAVDFHRRLGLRVSHAFLGPYCESSAAVGGVTIRLAAYQAAWISQSRDVLLVQQGEKAEILRDGQQIPSTAEELVIRGLLQRIVDSGVQQGFLPLHDLGDQLIAACHDWFGHLPSALMYFQLVGVIDGGEARVAILVPVTPALRMCGKMSSLEVLEPLISVARLSLTSARSRFLSSDALLVTQRLIAEREDELSDLVHLVNNVAQEISVHCDALRERIGSGAAVRGETAWQPLREVESTAQNLSRWATDVKLFHELARLGSFKHEERVPVRDLIGEIEAYADYRERRGLEKVELINRLPTQGWVRVISGDYLATAVRGLLREAAHERGACVKLELAVVGDVFSLTVEGAGIPQNPGVLKQIGMGGEPADVPSPTLRRCQAVAKLAILSGGAFEILQGSVAGAGRAIMHLPWSADSSAPQGLRRKAETVQPWVLFVDDNHQVTTFYGRVAEALGLTYAAVGSVSEASELLKSRRPSLIVTDIQLGEDSGLEIVSRARGQYGSEIPVIVVSGEGGEAIASQARSLGVRRFLTKPLGRSQLVREIQEALYGQKG